MFVSHTISAPVSAPLLVVCLLLLPLGGCSGVDVLNALAPTGDLTITRDVAYGPNPRHRLDVYRPQHARKSLPVVVFLYGGSWQSGEKGDYLFVAEAFASRGFVVVVPDYRVYPEVTYPAFLEDTADAVEWTRRHVEAYGGDPATLFLIGHSAGAYNAVMMGLDTPYLADRGIDRASLAGIVGLAGPYDFLPVETRDLRAIFHVADDPRTTQPITHVVGPSPPFYLLHGLEDQTVEPGNTRRLAAALREAALPVRVTSYQDLDHTGIIAALSRPLRGGESVLEDVVDWLQTRVRHRGEAE